MPADASEKRKILVVEDDAMILQFVTVLLDSEGYDVVAAEDGRQMFDALSAQKFDLIVLDIMLPDGNGVDFARKLRATDATVPIVFATGVTDLDTKRRAAGLMQVYYVNKPYDADTLLSHVNAMFEGSAIMQTPDEPAPTIAPDDESETAWYAAPLVWGPALVFVLLVATVLFLIPDAEQTADTKPATQLETAQAEGEGEEADPASGIVMKDAANQPASIGAGGTGAAGGGAGTNAAGGPAVIVSPEEKVAQGCGQLPVSEHWNNNSIKRILRYVRFVHRGDWGAYLDAWLDRITRVQDLQAQGKPIELKKKGVIVSGRELSQYLELMDDRIKFLRCAERIIQTVE